MEEVKRSNDAKEPDQSWALARKSDVETVLEVVWCNKCTKEFIAEMRDWHDAGRNVLGLGAFWDGKTGSAALDSPWKKKRSKRRFTGRKRRLASRHVPSSGHQQYRTAQPHSVRGQLVRLTDDQ